MVLHLNLFKQAMLLCNLEIIKLVEVQTFMIRILIPINLYDCMIRMIA
jgi:hypothetical protein